MSQSRDNNGAAFSNSLKKWKPRDKTKPDAPREPLDEREAKKPDYTGPCTVDGKCYWIAVWKKHSPNAGNYFSFAFKPREEQEGE